MAPRTAKAKKATNVKAVENEAPKKGRGKAKTFEAAEPEVQEVEVEEKVAPTTETKPKRGKKAAIDSNGQEETKKEVEETTLPAKRSRKKNVEKTATEEKPANGDDNHIEESDQNSEHSKSNGDVEDEQTTATGKGRKKQTKKTVTKDVPVRKASNEEKAKPAGKARGRKPKVEKEAELEEKTENGEEEVKAELPPAKGRKKAQPKTVKEKTPESEKEEHHEQNEEEDTVENKPVEESKKKEAKRRKGNQGKKAQTKEVEEKDEEENEVVEEELPASKRRKVTKKKSEEEPIDEDAPEEVSEVKPKGKRGQKKVADTPAEAEVEAQDTSEATNKRRRKAAEEKDTNEDPKKKAPPKNKATTNYEELDFSNTSKNAQGKDWNFKIASWNVDGIRAWLNKGGLDYVKYEKPDILCLQEIKCAQDKLPDEIANLPGYHAYWLCSDKDGYAGVAIYTAKLAMNVQYGLQNEELDNEGRIITAEYEQFYLICTYVPNAGRKLVTLPKRLQWNEEFRKHVKELDKKKPVIICGDMNVAHNEIDLANPKTNKKNAGFTEEERSGMTELLGDGFVDTYRHMNPDKTGAYTFWTYMMNSRSKNVGWRLDYFIVSERLLQSVCDNVIRDQVYGSDHCPISLFLHLSTANKPKE